MSASKVALITGISGQDGSYLAELLLSKGYEVHGLVRRVALEDPQLRLGRIAHILDQLHLHPASLESYASIYQVVDSIEPTECYHLAAQSFVKESFEDPFSTFRCNLDGTLHVLEALRHRAPQCKLYFAGSSEMFGRVMETPQTETTPFYPRSPYGVTKVAGFDLCRNYRESYDMFCSSGILFNHESPRRGFEFVTRKITDAVAKIHLGKQDKLALGNLDAKRDWGFAGDYVKAMYLMLQQNDPDDYVVSTGQTHSVREFCKHAFDAIGKNYEDYVEVDPRFYRPAEVDLLLGDATKAKQKLGWEPEVCFESLVKMMVEQDIQRLEVL